MSLNAQKSTYFLLIEKETNKQNPLPKIKVGYQAQQNMRTISSNHHQFSKNMSRTKEILFHVYFQPGVFIIAITN